MAPEQVFSVIALDLTVVNGDLRGTGERIDMFSRPLFVTWYAAEPLEDHVVVMDGLLQIPVDTHIRREVIRNVHPADLGDGRYAWRDPPPQWGALMFAIVMPVGQTLATSNPAPVQAKVHAGRLAAFWLLPQSQQVVVTFKLAAAGGSTSEEAQRLNREALDRMLPTQRGGVFQYDVALSFAGEDREYVEEVAEGLRAAGVRVFYDRFEEVNLWGKNLYDHLSDVYKNQARYTVMFISVHYASKVWTSHERQNAQERALKENAEYILPARFDDTAVPGLSSAVGYLSLHGRDPASVADLICRKVTS